MPRFVKPGIEIPHTIASHMYTSSFIYMYFICKFQKINRYIDIYMIKNKLKIALLWKIVMNFGRKLFYNVHIIKSMLKRQQRKKSMTFQKKALPPNAFILQYSTKLSATQRIQLVLPSNFLLNEYSNKCQIN